MPVRGPRPTQAVIFAGGQGTRLGTLTEHIPKPLVRVAGRPFIDYLIELLRDQGFERIVMLLGHRAEAMAEYLDDGSRWGVQISLSITSPHHQTLTRLRTAAPLLDDIVLIAYCDNYVPLDFSIMWREFTETAASVQVTAYANDEGFTRNNMLVDDAGLVREYDPTRSSSGLNRVDLGFAIADLGRLGPLPTDDKPFEHAVYPQLVNWGQLRSTVTQHRYYGVGSLDRLPAAERFFARRPAVILTRAGVLNWRTPTSDDLADPAGFVWLDGALTALRLLTKAGFLILVATDQAGMARGPMSADRLAAVDSKLIDDATAAGAQVERIYHCSPRRDDRCACRNPALGLLYQAQHDFALDLSRTVFVGGYDRDELTARAAGCAYRQVGTGCSLLDVTCELTAGVM